MKLSYLTFASALLSITATLATAPALAAGSAESAADLATLTLRHAHHAQPIVRALPDEQARLLPARFDEAVDTRSRSEAGVALEVLPSPQSPVMWLAACGLLALIAYRRTSLR